MGEEEDVGGRGKRRERRWERKGRSEPGGME